MEGFKDCFYKIENSTNNELFLITYLNEKSGRESKTIIPTRKDFSIFLNLLEHSAIRKTFTILEIKTYINIENFYEVIEEFKEKIDLFKGGIK